METDLRDLDEDRRYCRPEDSAWDTPTEIRLKNLAIAALDEIDRLKRMLVWKNWDGDWTGTIAACQISGDHQTKAAAWAEVRKVANDGK